MARRESGLFLFLAIIIAIVTARNPHFLKGDNVRDLLMQCTQPAIVACGVMLVIVTGEIDISVGGALGLLTAVLGWLISPTHWGWPVAMGIVTVLVLGTVIGLINGLLVTVARVPSIVVTLATMTILKGITTLLMKPGDITDMPEAARVLGIGAIGGIPVSVLLAALVVAVTAAMIRHTPLGRRIYAVGSNAHAAALVGISEARVKVFAFAATGFLVAVAALVTRLATVTSGFGQGFELLVVTCVVVGGVSISGGIGTVSGVILGVILLTIQKPVLIFLSLGTNAAYWEKAIQGGLIFAAVLADYLLGQRNQRVSGERE